MRGKSIHSVHTSTARRAVIRRDDTGSTGLAVAKAGVKLGYLDRYEHTFSFTALQATVETTPTINGTVWTKGQS